MGRIKVEEKAGSSSKKRADVGKGVAPKIKVKMVVLMASVHIFALIGIWKLFTGQFTYSTLVTFVITFWMAGLGITAGAHRLWAHKSYTAKDPLRFFLMICSCISNQGTLFHWVRDHRIHHKHSEGDADPHDARRGMFFSHIGWLLVDKNAAVLKAGKIQNMEDMEADWTVMLQENNKWMNWVFSWIVPATICNILGDTYWNGFFIAGMLRYVFVLHATWCVNSIAHFYGQRPYNEKINPSENVLVSIMTGGEGYHNWHHVFPYDYSASEWGLPYQFNPTKLFIDFMASIGQVTSRKRHVIKKQGILPHKGDLVHVKQAVAE